MLYVGYSPQTLQASCRRRDMGGPGVQVSRKKDSSVSTTPKSGASVEKVFQWKMRQEDLALTFFFFFFFCNPILRAKN